MISWMGWTKIVYTLVAFPVLAASPETVATETFIVATETVTVTSINDTPR